MSMTKKDFIALADIIKAQIAREKAYTGLIRAPFTFGQISELADFCQTQSKQFNRLRWIQYITGQCGPNGGKV